MQLDIGNLGRELGVFECEMRILKFRSAIKRNYAQAVAHTNRSPRRPASHEQNRCSDFGVPFKSLRVAARAWCLLHGVLHISMFRANEFTHKNFDNEFFLH